MSKNNNASLFIAMAHTMPKLMSLDGKIHPGESRHMRTIMQFADDINSNKIKNFEF